MADVKPKFKFKKPKAASLKKRRIRRDSDDAQDANDDTAGDNTSADQVTSNQEDTEEPSALDKIRQVGRRRKILLSRNRGVDAANLGKQTLRHKSTAASDDDEEVVAAGNKDLEERLKGTFSEGKLAGSNDMGGDVEGGILAKKHKKAMEEYIKSNLHEQPVERTASASNNIEEGETFKSTADIEKEMYSELLGTDTAAKVAEDAEEGDVGAGGAMMGGTGIAEVTLPIDDRLKAVKDTERAAAEHEKARKARLGIVDEEKTTRATSNDVELSDDMNLAVMVPIGFASGPGKRKRKDMTVSAPAIQAPQQKPMNNSFDPTKDFQYPLHSSAIPAGSFIERGSDADNNLGASYSHNYAQHNREWIEEKKNERQAEIDAIAAQNEETGPEESKARLGFEASRKIARGEAVGTLRPGGLKEAELKKGTNNDDRVWKTFMSNPSNRR